MLAHDTDQSRAAVGKLVEDRVTRLGPGGYPGDRLVIVMSGDVGDSSRPGTTRYDRMSVGSRAQAYPSPLQSCRSAEEGSPTRLMTKIMAASVGTPATSVNCHHG